MFDPHFNSYFPGEEAISYQATSPLHKGLTAIFQEAVDHRDQILETITGDKKRLEEIHDFVEKKTAPKLKNFIEKETGLLLKKFVISNGDPAYFGMFAIDLSMDDLDSAIFTTGKLQGTIGSTPEDKMKQKLKETMEMSDNLDLETGKLISNMYGKNRKIIVTIYIDVISGFLPDAVIPISSPDARMTASELASIIMHEIGHILTVVEHAKYWHSVVLSRDQLYKAATVSSKVEDVLETIAPTIIECIEKTRDKGLLSSDYSKTLIDALRKITDDGKKTDKHTNEDEEEDAGSFIGSVTLQLLWHFCWVYFYASGAWVFAREEHALFDELVKAIQVSGSEQGAHRTTDVKHTGHNMTKMERIADEYVSRHGASQYLATALIKLDRMFAFFFSSAGGIKDSRVRNMRVFRYMLEFRYLISRSVMNFPHPLYEGDFERINRMRQNALGVFRTANLPKEMVDRYLDDLAGIERAMVKQRSNPILLIARGMEGVLRRLTIGQLITTSFSANLMKDYHKLFDQIDVLSNNRLYLQAYRLERHG